MATILSSEAYFALLEYIDCSDKVQGTIREHLELVHGDMQSADEVRASLEVIHGALFGEATFHGKSR